MTETDRTKPPAWFWIVAVLGLLWCLMGVTAYLMHAYGETPMSEAQRTLSGSMPPWVMGAWATAVFAGAIGCIGLLIRKQWAKLLLSISLAAALAQQLWLLAVSDALALLGPSAAILPICVMLIAIGLVWLAMHSARKGWIA